MPKTRRRAGDRTAGAGWQLCCLIDRAEELKFLNCLFRILGNTRTACMNKQFNCSLGFERRLRIELSKTGIPFRLYDADKKRKRIAINPNGIFEDSVFTNDLRAIA